MVHPNRRTWTLGALDREVPHLLWFDDEAFRWECRPVQVEGTEGQASDVADHVAKRVDATPTVLGGPVPWSGPGVTLRSVLRLPGGC